MMTPEQVAKICHEANRALCESFGDTTQAPWRWAPQWAKDSAIEGVRKHLKYPGLTPEQSHEEWMKSKQADGWVYGTMKNAEKKEHPCMVPYSQLPLEQKAKDYLFGGIVDSLRHATVV